MLIPFNSISYNKEKTAIFFKGLLINFVSISKVGDAHSVVGI